MATLVQQEVAVAAPATISSEPIKYNKEENEENKPVLQRLIASTNACILRPFSFFVSWNGVLTLAYKGFPPALKALKQDINNNLQCLARENPGSRWPKTSLGALKQGQRLTPAQLALLNSICTELSGVFQSPQSPKSQAVLVDQLEMVAYECRCLERAISRQVLPLAGGFLDLGDPPQEEVERVVAIVGEASSPNYWYHASKDGSREDHYRSTALGVTLVHSLACFTGRKQVTPPVLGQSLSRVSSLEREHNRHQGHASSSGAGSASAHAVGQGGNGQQQAHAAGPGEVAGVGPSSSNGAASALGSLLPSTLWPAAAAGVMGLLGVGHAEAQQQQGSTHQQQQADAHSNHVFSSALPSVISAFRARVDKELPGMYAWFDDASLHITVRAIMG